MVKQHVFTFKLDDDDRRRLQVLARHHQRTQSDILRQLIRRHSRDLVKKDASGTAPMDPATFVAQAWAEVEAHLERRMAAGDEQKTREAP